jgi:hypothetical protein
MMYRCTYRGGNGRLKFPACGQRVKLRTCIELYAKRPHCPACGRDSLRLDIAQAKRNRRLTCLCGGVPYPHNRGTVIGCTDYAKSVTEEQYREHLDNLKAASIKGNRYA